MYSLIDVYMPCRQWIVSFVLMSVVNVRIKVRESELSCCQQAIAIMKITFIALLR